MANQELYDKQYKIPADILNGIKATLVGNPSGDGVKRAKFLVRNGTITYQAMKRLKNFFDHFNPQLDNKNQYALAGGNSMKAFIETTLNSDRHAVKASKEIKRDMTANPNSELRPYQTPRLNEEKKEKKKNVVGIVIDNDNKFLLLKRADDGKIWMPNKWSFVGGEIEKNETPKKAIEREIQEETGLVINKFIKSFTIQRNTDSTEHVFACRYNGEPTDIKLNDENTNYGWYDVSEMKYLDIVPHLLEYITIVFKKYE